MKREGTDLRLAASDITTFAACVHASALDVGVSDGRLARPFRPDASATLLRERGFAHERACLAELTAKCTVETITLSADG